MVFRGKLDIPVIDWRHYLETELDMHNSHQSFAARQRLLNYDGDASNQLIWFTDARPATPQFDQTPQAFLVLDQWIENIQANPEKSVAENKPADAEDACFATNGTLLASGDGVWSGILDDGPAGRLHAGVPDPRTSRIVAGGPIEGGVFQCALQPVEAALAQGPLRLVGADGRRGRAAEADLPERSLRLLEARPGPAAGALRQLEGREEVEEVGVRGPREARPPRPLRCCR